MESLARWQARKSCLSMGHTACGAIKGAIDEVQIGNPDGFVGEDPSGRRSHTLHGRALG